MRTPVVVLLSAVMSWAAVPLAAQTVYKWVDEDGYTHYGHAIPPEYADQAHERLEEGVVRGRVERALTPEERDEARRQRQLERETLALERSRESQDRLLLAAYSSEADIVQSMESELALVRSQMGSVSASKENALRRFEDLVGRAAERERSGRPVPDAMVESIVAVRDEVGRHREDLERVQQRLARTERSFTEDLARYRELRGRRDG